MDGLLLEPAVGPGLASELLPLLRAFLSCELVCPCLTLYADGGGGSACTRRLRLDQLVVCCLQDSDGNLAQLRCAACRTVMGI